MVAIHPYFCRQVVPWQNFGPPTDFVQSLVEKKAINLKDDLLGNI